MTTTNRTAMMTPTTAIATTAYTQLMLVLGETDPPGPSVVGALVVPERGEVNYIGGRDKNAE